MNSRFPVFILTGFHRSGTSLIGRYLLLSGINMGAVLLGPHPSNPYGHFEDVEVLDFHTRILKRERGGEDQWVKKLPKLEEAEQPGEQPGGAKSDTSAYEKATESGANGPKVDKEL